MTVGGISLLQLLLTGLALGAVYSLIGLGLTLVNSTTRVINIAIGDFAMFGALIAVSLVAAGLPVAVAFLVAIAIGCAAGAATYVLAIRPAQRRSDEPLAYVILTIGLHLAFVGIGLIVWGTGGYSLPPLTSGPPVRIAGAMITRQSIWILFISFGLYAFLNYFFSRANLGRALRAAAVNPEGARVTGVRVTAMGLLAFTLSAGLAAAAGVLITPQTLARYDMGLTLALKGFIGSAVGNLESYPGTVAGCFLLGLLESFSAGLLTSGYKDAIAFSLLILVLLWRAVPAVRKGVLTAEESAV